MAPPQGETRVGKVSLAFIKTGRWLQSRLSQVQAIAHGKGSNYTSDSSSGRRNTSSSVATQLPADNQLPATMSEQGYVLPLQASQLNLYVNLPPPPPPPSSAIPLLIQPATPVEQRIEFNQGQRAHEFSEIEQQHDRIVAKREDLMGCRFQMKTDRRKIREIRAKAGAQEGSVMNQLRTFLHKQSIALPRDIEETFEQIDGLRDQLGLLEAEYDGSEQDYTMKEVEYSGHEMDFIDKLRSVHSRCPAAPAFVPIQSSANSVDRASIGSSHEWEIAKESSKVTDPTLSEKTLQLLPTEVHLGAEDIDKSQAREIAQFSVKPNVDDWIVNTIFQSPIPNVYLEDPEQNIQLDEDSSLAHAPKDWYSLGTIGAQFQDEEWNGSRSRSKEEDIA